MDEKSILKYVRY